MAMKSINPATGELLKTYSHLSKDETTNIVERAHLSFLNWRETPMETRKAAILQFADLLRQNIEQLSQLITLEMGKRISESEYEIEYCAKIAEFYANGAKQFLADEPVDVDGAEAFIQYVPTGTILGVMPWNFPFYQVVRFAIPNIMAGNTILLRHASNVPQCAEALEDLFNKSGLAAGIYNNLFIPTEFVDPIIAHQKVRGVSLTGSEAAGAAVAATAGKNIKPSVLELGGNDPFIVLKDADLKLAIQEAVRGRLVNTGQSCVAAKRFIVIDSIARKFTAGMKKAMASLKMGDPLDPSTDIGPLSSEAAAIRLQDQVTSAIQSGAKTALGGSRPKREGAFFNPTILTNVTPENSVYDDELFGPVAVIHTVKTEDEAIELANNSSFGLGGSVHSQDTDRALAVAREINTGMVFINQSTRSQAELPFGGTKNSGYGRELSHLGILEFVNKKLIYQKKSEDPSA
ncbi:MAG: NAD-dependent succinate-semialdehyde dehydrogenase [Akkermansiaceae bacterium]